MSRQPKPRQKTSYSDEERESALARLALNSGNILKTAREIGISQNTIRRWRDAERDRWERIRDEKKKQVIGLVYEIAVKASVRLNAKLTDDDEAEEISARDLATITGIMTDKAVSLENSISGGEDQDSAINEFIEEIKGRRASSKK